ESSPSAPWMTGFGSPADLAILSSTSGTAQAARLAAAASARTPHRMLCRIENMAQRSECAWKKQCGKRNVPVDGSVRGLTDVDSQANILRSDGIKSKMKPSVFCALLLLLSACAANRTVEARIAQTGESFTGTFDPGTLDGSLEMQSTAGVNCTGRS